MALNKFYNKFNDDNVTQTIVSDYSGMIFKGLIFNGSDTDADIWLYIEDGGTLYKKTLSPNETFEFEPKIILQNENLKLYSSKAGVESIIEILVN
jgi:hypothetical protein